jgi:hypothetical protein
VRETVQEIEREREIAQAIVPEIVVVTGQARVTGLAAAIAPALRTAPRAGVIAPKVVAIAPRVAVIVRRAAVIARRQLTAAAAEAIAAAR